MKPDFLDGLLFAAILLGIFFLARWIGARPKKSLG